MANEAKKPTDEKQGQASKMPDFKEITEMASKLINDVKKSVSTIYQDYKSKHQVASNDESDAGVDDKPDVKAKKESEE